MDTLGGTHERGKTAESSEMSVLRTGCRARYVCLVSHEATKAKSDGTLVNSQYKLSPVGVSHKAVSVFQIVSNRTLY